MTDISAFCLQFTRLVHSNPQQTEQTLPEMSNKENERQDSIYEEEDELSAIYPTDQVTPQQSLASRDGSSAKPTPYANVRLNWEHMSRSEP